MTFDHVTTNQHPIDHIELVPDEFGWKLVLVKIIPAFEVREEYVIGDAIQFHAETERTIGRWLADGPDDFHNSPDPPEFDPDLARDIERGK